MTEHMLRTSRFSSAPRSRSMPARWPGPARPARCALRPQWLAARVPVRSERLATSRA